MHCLECCQAHACLRASSLGQSEQSLHATLVADGLRLWLTAGNKLANWWLMSAPIMAHDCNASALTALANGAGDTGGSEQWLESHRTRVWTNATIHNSHLLAALCIGHRTHALHNLHLLHSERCSLPFREICCPAEGYLT